MTQQELLKKIEQAKRTNAKTLDLSNNQLTTLPEEITQLTQLKELDLSHNNLTTLPEGITQLTQLKELDLSYNQLTTLPEEIAQLTQLTTLYLYRNQLTTLPETITRLTQLKKLSLWGNNLTTLPEVITRLTPLTDLDVSGNDLTTLPEGIGKLVNLRDLNLGDGYVGNELTTLPEEIAQLTQLTTLYLSRNRLTTLPETITRLTQLKELDLSNNQLTTLPEEITKLTQLTMLNLSRNRLTTLPKEITRLTQLKELDLSNNPLTSPPPEIVSQGVEAIFEYMRRLQRERKERQWVSKLLVVGQGGAGKTNLVRRLKEEEFQEQEETTRGIAIRPLVLPHPAEPDVVMTLNTWDFAGQEIEHATHQFFLTNRSLFLLVWNARQGFEASKIYYWLETIRTRAGKDVPIVLVAAHADQRSPDLPLADLQRAYPQILASFAVSNKTGAGIGELRDALARFAADPKVLPLMGGEWPAKWLEAANTLRAAPEEEKRISLRTLHQRLAAQELTPEEIEVLTQYLHELGDILHFRDNEELKDLVILKPQWVTQHIAQVFKSEDVIGRDGILTRVEMENLWPDLERDFQERLLDLMEQFDLSYRTRENPELSLVVERVPFEEPDTYPSLWESFRSQEHCREVTMKYELSSIPAGIPTWFIARQHRFSLHLHWRYGVLFGDDSKNPRHLGLLHTDPQTNSLRLTVRGPFPVNLFSLLRDGLELTLARFPGLGITRKVPCPGHDGQPCSHEFDFRHLERRVEKNKLDIECPVAIEDVSVAEMLFGVGWNAQDPVLNRITKLAETLRKRPESVHPESTPILSEEDGLITFLEGLTNPDFDRYLLRLPEVAPHVPAGVPHYARVAALIHFVRSSAGPGIPRLVAVRSSVFPQYVPPTETSANKLALSQREFLKEYEEAQRFPETCCPNVFVLYGNADKKPHIQLLCQEPGDWHPLKDSATGTYIVNAPASLPYEMAFYLKKLFPYLKRITPLSSPLVGEEFSEAQARQLLQRLQQMESLVGKLPDGERFAHSHGLSKEGPQLQPLRRFMASRRKQPPWGGLERVRTPEGHYLWVCPYHARQYKR